MSVLNNPSVRRLIALLRATGPMPRLQVAKALNVQPSTVTRMVTPLIDSGLIEEIDDAAQKGRRGFPARLITLNPTGFLSAGVFIDPEQCHTCIVNSFGELLSEETVPLSDLHLDAVMGLAARLVSGQMDRLGLSADRFLGCGISYPGQHTGQPGVSLPTRYFPDWPKFDARTELLPYFGMPVYHLNDAKSACLAELMFGACTGVANFCYIWLSHGIGGAAVIDHRLYLGKAGAAAEYGGLFPKSAPRPSGADLLACLAAAGLPHDRLDRIPPEVLDGPVVRDWLHRAEGQLRQMCLVIARTFAPDVIVLGGQLPDPILCHLIGALSGPQPLAEDFGIEPPRIIRAQADKYPQLGAAAVPVYFGTMTGAE